MSHGRGNQRIGDFPNALRRIKERTPHSFGTLAARTGLSRSALHRYCSGQSVPREFAPVERFAMACGAERAELIELHGLWVLATEAVSEPVTDPVDPTDPVTPTAPTNPVESTAPTGPTDRVGPTAPAGRKDATGQQDLTGQPDPTGRRDLTSPGGDDPPAATEDSPPGTPRGVLAGGAGDGADSVRRTAQRPGGAAAARWPRGTGLAVGALAVAMVLGGSALWLLSGVGPIGGDTRLLFSEACDRPLGIGETGSCADEVHRLLAEAGAESLLANQRFDRETRSVVMAFQALADESTNGVVDDATKRALYEQRVDLDTWDDEQVRRYIARAFTAVGPEALRVAECQSGLQPLHAGSDPEVGRTWGVFQLSEEQLDERGAAPVDALDPEWNIDTAYEIWSESEDFAALPSCAPRQMNSPGTVAEDN